MEGVPSKILVRATLREKKDTQHLCVQTFSLFQGDSVSGFFNSDCQIRGFAT